MSSFQIISSQPNQDLSKLSSSTKLGELLQLADLVSPLQIELALQEQIYQSPELKIGEILALRGWLKPETADFFAHLWPRANASYRCKADASDVGLTGKFLLPRCRLPIELIELMIFASLSRLSHNCGSQRPQIGRTIGSQLNPGLTETRIETLDLGISPLKL